ncbi:MAG: CsgG/HfaB family protein [Elusimicrobiota bacterium]
MKRALIALICLAALSLGPTSWAKRKPASKKQRIAVMDFEDKSGHRYQWRNVGRGMAEMLATSLVQTGRFVVVERAELDKMLREQRLGASGAVVPGTAAKIGRMIGAGMLVTGAVTEFGVKESKLSVGKLGRKFGIDGGAGVRRQKARCVVDLRIIDAASGQLLAAETAEGVDNSHGISADVSSLPSLEFGTKGFDETTIGKAVREAVEKSVSLVERHAEALPWFGRIVKVGGGRLLINTGEEDGRKPGDEFLVERAGEELVDPDTGESLGSETQKVGRIRIVEVRGKKLSAAEPMDGAGFQVGDILKE